MLRSPKQQTAGFADEMLVISSPLKISPFASD